MPDLPDGHVDTIEIAIVRNGATQVNEIERDKTDWMQTIVPADLYNKVKDKYEGTQFRVEYPINLYFFWMNTQEPPFDDLEVRQAVNYAVDSAAMERIYAGSLSASHQILPEGMPGHEEFDLYPYDMAKAKALIEEADPADRDITVWTINESPNDEAGAYFSDVLGKLGFNAKLKTINADNYFTVIGNASTPDLDTGWTAWIPDYPNPNGFFQPLLSGESIAPDLQQQLRENRRPEAEREGRQAQRRTARTRAGRRIRRARPGIYGTGPVGSLRHQHALDLRLQRD